MANTHVESDAIDQQIISALRDNPRVTNRVVSQHLGLAEATVAQRIRRMFSQSMMKTIAQQHIFTKGYTVVGFLFIKTSLVKVQTILAKIAKIDDVISASQGIGNPDVVVFFRAKSNTHAHQMAASVGTMRGIDTIDINLCFGIHKYTSNMGRLSVGDNLQVSDALSKDDALLAIFSQDGRISNREAARQVGLSESATRQRLNKMLRAGQIQFEVICNPDMFGINVVAIVRITTKAKYTDSVIKEAMACSEVTFVAEASGQYNLVLLVATTDTLALGNLCDNRLLSMRGVEALNVHLLVFFAKHSYHLSHFEAQKNI